MRSPFYSVLVLIAADGIMWAVVFALTTLELKGLKTLNMIDYMYLSAGIRNERWLSDMDHKIVMVYICCIVNVL